MASSRTRPPEDDVVAALGAALDAAAVGAATRLCVALSGGLDSIVLLDALAGLRRQRGFALAAAHVHHGLSPNADRWRDFCVAACAARSVSLQVSHVHVDRRDPAGVEAAARAARQRALAASACDWMMFAHHRDDQAETVLFRLLRGTGLRGAGAMRMLEPGSPGRMRPFLDLPREHLVRHAHAQGLEWVEDESNQDLAFSRNFLRHRVFPLIRQRMPGASAALARAAAHMREADTLLEDLASIDEQACGGAILRRQRVLELPDRRILNLLRHQLRKHAALAPPQAQLLEALRQLRSCDSLYFPLGAMALAAYRDKMLVLPHGQPCAERGWDGEERLPWHPGELAFVACVGAGLSLQRLAPVAPRVTTRWPGLAMRLASQRPRRSFKNLCQEACIPDWLRPYVPVLRVGDEPIWIAGVGVAASWRCGPDEPGVMPHWRGAAVQIFAGA